MTRKENWQKKQSRGFKTLTNKITSHMSCSFAASSPHTLHWTGNIEQKVPCLHLLIACNCLSNDLLE